jgi:hypothetical protein
MDVIVRDAAEAAGFRISYLNETTVKPAASDVLYWLPAHDESANLWKDLHKTDPATGYCDGQYVCHAPGLWGNMLSVLSRLLQRP